MRNDKGVPGMRSASGRTMVLLCLIGWLSACGSAPPPRPIASTAAPVAAPTPVRTLSELLAIRTTSPEDYERGLQVLSHSADAITSRRATTLLALFSADQKRTAEALTRLADAASQNPAVAPWLRLRAVDAARSAGLAAPAIALATGIIQDTPASSAATIARLILPALYLDANDEANLSASLVAISAIPIDELTEGDFVGLATQLAARGRVEAASAIRMRLLTQFPQGRLTEQTYDFLSRAVPSPLDALSFDESMKLATQLARADRYDQSLDFLQRVSLRFPGTSTSAAYRTARLRALFNSRQYKLIGTELNAASPAEPNLLLLQARAAWRDARPQEFLAGLDRVEKEFPGSPEAVEAKVLRSKYYTTDEVKLDLAIQNLDAAIAAGSIGSEGETLWTLGWTLYLAGRVDDALKTFERYGQLFPDGDYLSNSLFWTGKIHQRFGHIAERDAAFGDLLAKYPYSYFSYRARQIQGRPPVAPSQIENGNVFPDVEGQITAVTDPRLTSVRELAALGLNRDAVREMKILAASNPDNLGLQFLLADLYVQGDEPFKANGILQRKFRQFVRHGGTGVPQRFWEILFPLSYGDTIRSEASKRQLDPYLIASIIRQESGFEPAIVSNAGAVGIMQIMPREADAIATAAGLPPISREQLFDPVTNIAIGAAEYSQKLAAMNGNDTLAIAAYNAGEDAVRRWLAHTPLDDIDAFVESIPYAETRLYVKSVSRNRFEYRRIYENVPQRR